MLRLLLLHLSRAGWARKLLTTFPPARRAARRFVAGETLEDALAVVRRLNAQGIDATLDHLGESVTNAAQARRATDDYLVALDKLARADVRSNVSLKLTQLGLDISEELCLDNLSHILEKARQGRNFVRVDMESSQYTDRTLRIVRRLRLENAFDNLGAVIQAYLYRSEADLRTLAEQRIPVRLCKGAYQEPPEVAFPRKPDVDANYIQLTDLLMDHSACTPPQNLSEGRFPPPAAIATHDPRMIEAAQSHAAERSIPRDRFEFQMLYGIRRELQARLAGEGYRMRVYVPYGTEWYPYFMRRLAERPANLWFFVSSYFRA